MTELSGMLDGLGLSAIVRFLSGLQKSGALRLAEDDWSGDIYFDAGKLTNATLGTRSGLAALDALVELLPRASFTFDSNAVAPGAPTIELDHEALIAHLEDVAAKVARGERTLPAADAVPVQASADTEAEEPVQLDRASLQTLMLVDGERDVREIVASRGSFDALWQLARLLESGLIKLGPRPTTPMVGVTPPVIAPEPPQAAPAEPTVIAAAASAAAPGDETLAEAVAHCPKLGFEDDPSSSFGRPTRLHRCFASAGRPLPLSLDQQRELCLSEQFGTCPRLAGAAVSPPGRAVRPMAANVDAVPSSEPRIVRLPFAGRPTAPERELADAVAAEPVEGAPSAAPEPRRLRSIGARGRDAATGPAREVQADEPSTLTNPTPLRARLNRVAPGAAVAAPPAAPAERPVTEPPAMPLRRESPIRPVRPPVRDGDATPTAVPLRDRRIGSVPLLALPAIGLAALVLIGIALVLPQLGSTLSDETDQSSLPNTRLVESGTPVANLGLSRQTPVAAQATAAPTADVAAQPTADTTAAAAPTADALVAANPTAAPRAQATSVPTQQPTVAANLPLMDERFTTNDAGWPSSPTGAALVGNGAYRIVTRQAGQFAAVSAPVANVPNDVLVSATFQKIAGPQGGGYGIIVRDQDTAIRDGSSQDGHYYVLEAGDKGEIGIWRRDGDHWVDLLPWQHSDAVKPGTAGNDLAVRAVGNTLTLTVNGTPVAMRTDDTFTSGKVGLFVGGDGNQVAVNHFAIQAP